MSWILPLLFLALFHVTDAQIPLVKILNYATSNDTSRLFYTPVTEVAVLEDYDPSQFPVEKDLNIAMIHPMSPPANCTCPDLRLIHSIATASGQLKFERAENLNSYEEEIKDYGVAGYLAPFPGYCGSDQIELLEFYSPVLKEYRYDTSNNIWNYYQDFTYFFRPVRVLGYAYYSSASVWLTGTPPYIKQGLTGMAFNALSVRFDLVQTLSKNGQNSYVISLELIDQMLADGWSRTGTILPGPLSSQNDIETIRIECGQVQKCVQVLDPRTGIVRPQNVNAQTIQGEILGDCGYFLSPQAATTCFSQASQFYSYIPSYNNDTAIYGNYNDGGSGNSVGYAYPYTFLFHKL